MLLKLALVGVLLAGVGVGVRVAAWPIVHVTLPGRAAVRSQDAASPPLLARDANFAAVVARDPFRIDRRSSPVAYDPLKIGQASSAPPKPALVLIGIVWDGGQDPTALLEGLPGMEGPRAVRRGEALGPLRVNRIAQDRVVVVGLDTAWVLTVREPWR